MVDLDRERCTGCGVCIGDCIANNLKIMDGKAAVIGKCINCGHCVAVCPVNAVSVPEYEMHEVEEYDPETFTISPLNFLHAVKFRRSIRNFKNRPVEREKLERIVKAGQYTETAVNYQDVRFIMVQEGLDEIKALAWEGWLHYGNSVQESNPAMADSIRKQYEAHQKDSKTDRLFFDAPVLLVIASDVPLDGGLASANIEMMAAAEGLGVLFDGYVVRALNENPQALEWLGIGNKTIASCMLLGYPDISYQRTAPRKPADVIWR